MRLKRAPFILDRRKQGGSCPGAATARTLRAARASFSEAASKLGISQPSLSETIKRVEEELGVRVFERTTRSLSLTPEGEHAVAVAREAVRDFRLALESIVDRTQGRRGRLTDRSGVLLRGDGKGAGVDKSCEILR